MTTKSPPLSLSEITDKAKLAKAEADAAEAILKLDERKASLAERREYLLDKDLDFATVKALINQVDSWVHADPTRPIRIVLNCGGNLIPALALHDYLRWVRQKGVRVIIQVSGCCSGQAPIVLRAADEVYITEHGMIEISEVDAQMQGNMHDGESYLAWLRRLQNQQLSLLATPLLSKETLQEQIRFKHWMLDAQTSVEVGLAKPAGSMPSALLKAQRTDFGSRLPVVTTDEDRKLRADAMLAMAQAELAELDLRKANAEAARHGIVRFIDGVNRDSAAAAKHDLARAARLCDGDLTVLIFSNGGTIIDGHGFIDLCTQMRSSGRVINTEVIGYAASMGGALLQLGATRTMGRNSWLLIHRASSWWGRKLSTFEDGLSRTAMLERQVIELLASRSILTADEILERCRDHDWWLPAGRALRYGFIDEIR
jgi:ATP-dependent protease ClpP protease subunit